MTNHIHIAAQADQRGATITDDNGQVIQGIVSATVTLNPRERPTATLVVWQPVQVTVESPRVDWRGLEGVPTEALAAELARREAAQGAADKTGETP